MKSCSYNSLVRFKDKITCLIILQGVCFSMDPTVYMGCTASRKFKSFKGLKNWHFPEIQLHIPQREQRSMPTTSAHVCTQVCVHRYVHSRTPSLLGLHTQRPTGAGQWLTWLKHQGVWEASLTDEFDNPHLHKHVGPNMGESLMLSHLSIRKKKAEIWVLHRNLSK